MLSTLISFIIPNYNGANYLEACLLSVLGQIPNSCEVILVDDGSTDSSVSIIEDLFPNEIQRGILKLIKQKNQGVSIARNSGIENARGNYIAFIDSDDVLMPNFWKSVQRLLHLNYDIIEYKFCYFYSILNSKSVEKSDPIAPDIYEAKLRKFGYGDWFCFSSLYKRTVIERVRFPHGVKFCEDLMFRSELELYAQSKIEIPAVLYGYRQHASNTSNHVSKEDLAPLVSYFRANRIEDNSLHFLHQIIVLCIILRSHVLATGTLHGFEMIEEYARLKSRVWKRLFFCIKYMNLKKLCFFLFPVTFHRIRSIFMLVKKM